MEQLKPSNFPEANIKLLKPVDMTDDECSSLFAFTDGRQCISCFKLNLRQKLSVLMHGTIWLSVLSGETQPPVWLDCSKTVFCEAKETKNE